MTTTEDRLRGALRAEGDSLTPTEGWSQIEARLAERPTRSSRPVVLSAAAALLAVFAVVALVLRDDPDRSRVNAGVTDRCAVDGMPPPRSGLGVLKVPRDGASPQFLCDGTPVWVVRHADGSVSVLGALSRRPWGIGQLMEWCSTSRAFEDVHAARFDEDGRAIGGPTNGGAESYRFTVAGDQIDVSRSNGRIPRGEMSERPFAIPLCDGTDGSALIGHDFSQILEGSPRQAGTDQLRLLHADLVVETNGSHLCFPSAETCTSQLVVGDVDRGILDGRASNRLVLPGPFLARLDSSTLTELIRVASTDG